ncbi:uncharacterized protein LOC141585994 [Silene latifolia]|uniref:uncharacterized protein LOC141585994 n=1 Tax=Silene latifolia TaxID=37657 RepID=UPI003D77E950
MGEHGVGENVTTCYEDGKIIENVGKPEVTESELSLSSDDNAPRLDQDVAPPSQEDRPNVAPPPRIDYRGRIRSSANEDAYRGRIRHPRRLRLPGEDEHLNYGRAPLIRDLYSDSVRPLPSVNEDTYGGGGVRMSPFTTTHNYGTQQLCCAQQGQPMSSPTLIKNNSYAHSDRPLSSANEDAYSGGIRMRRDVTTRNYGKVPLTSDNFADASDRRPLPPVNEEAYGGVVVRMSPFTMRKDLGFLTSGFGRILCNRLLYFTVIVSIFCCLICRIVAR